MRIPARRFRWTVAFAAALLSARATPAEVFETPLPSGPTLELTPPADWRLQRQSNPIVTDVWLLAAGDTPATVLHLTVFKLAPESSVRSPEDLKRLVEDQGKSYLRWATQKQLETTRLALRDGAAFYYHLSDRGSKDASADFRELHHGAVLLSGHVVVFAVLSHSGDHSAVEKALAVVSSIRLVPNR